MKQHKTEIKTNKKIRNNKNHQETKNIIKKNNTKKQTHGYHKDNNQNKKTIKIRRIAITIINNKNNIKTKTE